MEPRQTRSEWERLKGVQNRRRMKRLVEKGKRPPGLLAYLGREPVGWICVEPREVFSKLARSRVLAPVDDQPVWSIVCFFVDRRYRRRGLSVALIEGAVDYARKKGARIIEGYPVATGGERGDRVGAFLARAGPLLDRRRVAPQARSAQRAAQAALVGKGLRCYVGSAMRAPHAAVRPAEMND